MQKAAFYESEQSCGGPITIVRSPPTARLVSKAALGLLVAAAGSICGCGSLSNDDRRTDRLLAERSAAIDSDYSPTASYPDPKSGDRPGMTNKTLRTDNPEPSQLNYTPADPDRNVEDRLRRFTQESMVGDPGAEQAEPPMEITLAEAFRIAQKSGREYLNQEEDYILAAIRLLIERHQWEPRFFNDTNAAVAGSGNDGDFQSAVNVINDLKVTKRLPYGGQAEAAWIWTATENLRDQAGGRYRQSSSLVFDAQIPLLRGAGLVAQESLIQAERDLVYQARAFEEFRRQYLVSIAKDYFGLLQSQAQIANQKRRLASLRQIEASVKAKVVAGRAKQFDAGIAENDVLSSVSSLAGARDSYIAQLDAFKIRLGVPVERPLAIKNLIFELAEPDITLVEATRRALDYRLDLQNQRDRLDDSRRSVKNARNNLLPDLNLTGAVTVPTNPTSREGGLVFSPGDTNYAAGVTFGLPLDRETERLQLRSAQLGLSQQERSFSQFEDSLILDVRSKVRAIDLARFQLRLAEKQVQINKLREIQQSILADKTTSQERVDSTNALLDAQNSRDSAQTSLRTAVLDYLLSTGQMRVGRDGMILPLPGMEIIPVTIFQDVEELDAWYKDPPPYQPTTRDEPGDVPGENPPPPPAENPVEEQVRDQLDNSPPAEPPGPVPVPEQPRDDQPATEPAPSEPPKP